MLFSIDMMCPVLLAHRLCDRLDAQLHSDSGYICTNYLCIPKCPLWEHLYVISFSSQFRFSTDILVHLFPFLAALFQHKTFMQVYQQLLSFRSLITPFAETFPSKTNTCGASNIWEQKLQLSQVASQRLQVTLSHSRVLALSNSRRMQQTCFHSATTVTMKTCTVCH